MTITKERHKNAPKVRLLGLSKATRKRLLVRQLDTAAVSSVTAKRTGLKFKIEGTLTMEKALAAPFTISLLLESPRGQEQVACNFQNRFSGETGIDDLVVAFETDKVKLAKGTVLKAVNFTLRNYNCEFACDIALR